MTLVEYSKLRTELIGKLMDIDHEFIYGAINEAEMELNRMVSKRYKRTLDEINELDLRFQKEKEKKSEVEGADENEIINPEIK